MRLISRALLLAAALVLGPTLPAAAQSDFPNKPIRVVVTFPPGGSADAVVRLLVPRLNDKFGHRIEIRAIVTPNSTPTTADFPLPYLTRDNIVARRSCVQARRYR